MARLAVLNMINIWGRKYWLIQKKSVFEDISAIVFTVAWNTHDVQ